MESKNALKKYTESGIAPPQNLVGIFAIAIVATMILGYVYNIAVRFISFIYINAIIVFGYGYVIGYLSRFLNIIFNII